MSSYDWIKLVLAVNLILSLLFVIWGTLIVPNTGIKEYVPGGRKRYVLLAAVFVLCPAVGILVYAMTVVFGRILSHTNVSLDDVVFSKERVETYARADEDIEKDITSFEEAIAISDYRSLRQLMLNVLRGDIKKSLAAISLALNSQDSETSHYAAAALRDELGGFRETVQKLYIEIGKRDDNCAKYCAMAIEYMNGVLEQHVLAQMEQNRYTLMLDEIGSVLYACDETAVTEEHYRIICMRLTDTNEFEKARKWCVVAQKQYPDRLSPYKCMLMLYYKSKDREEFFNTMKELRESQVTIDQETLELIRAFSV